MCEEIVPGAEARTDHHRLSRQRPEVPPDASVQGDDVALGHHVFRRVLDRRSEASSTENVEGDRLAMLCPQRCDHLQDRIGSDPGILLVHARRHSGVRPGLVAGPASMTQQAEDPGQD